MNSYSLKTLMHDWTEELMYNISKNTSSCIMLFDHTGKLLFMNEAVETLFGKIKAENLMNPSFEQLFEMENRGNRIFTGFITIGEQQKKNSSIIAEIYRKNNQFLILGGVNASQLMEQNETMHHLNTEITELQRKLMKEKKELSSALKKLNKLNHELELSNATKDKFFNIIAHDLKNPFNSILGFSNLILKRFDKADKAKLKEYAKVINSAASNSYKLLENLLEWARAQTGKIHFEPELIPLENLINELAGLNDRLLRDKLLTLVQDIPPAFAVYADRNMLSTILRNLISNAVKFSHSGSKIIIRAEKQNRLSCISIQDFGVGMSLEKQKTLFDISQKVSTNGTQNEKGTGLGLLLVKEFTESHGGHLNIESTPDTGSTFTICLPNH